MIIKSLVLVLLPVFFIAACSNQSNGEEEIIRKVKVEKVQKASDVLRGNFSGVIEEARDVNLAFRVAGPIQAIYVKEGSFVKEGQLVAEIDPRDYQTQVNVAQAQYNQVKAEAQRVIELYKRKSVADNDYDKAVSGDKLVTAQLKHAQDQLNDTKLYAPFSGYIQDINYESGEIINTGMPLASLIDMNKYIIEVDIPSTLFVQKENFVSFSCRSFGTGSKELPLRLISYTMKANANQLYKLYFQLNPGADTELKPGMSMKVFIDYANPVDAPFLVSMNAVFYDNAQSYVWVFNKADSTVIKTPVVVGDMAENGNIRIKEGVSETDTVVVAGTHVLKEDQKVEIVGPASKTNVGGLL